MNEQITMLKREPHWIPIERGDKGYSAGDFIYSECEKPCPCYHLTKYCPNCGARMERRNDEHNT